MNNKIFPLLGLFALFLWSCNSEDETPQNDINSIRTVSASINSTVPEQESNIESILMKNGYKLELKVRGQEDVEIDNSLEIGKSYSVDFDLDGSASIVFSHPDQYQIISPFYFYHDSIVLNSSTNSGKLVPRNVEWAMVKTTLEDDSVTSIKIDGQDLFTEEENIYYAAVRVGEVSTLQVYRGEEIETYNLSEIEIGEVFEKNISPLNLEIENEAFAQAIMADVDTDGDGGISMEEALSVSEIHLEGVDLNILNDLIYFENLERFICYGCGLNSINLIENSALTYLDLSLNYLETIDVSSLSNLVELIIPDNNLTTIDLSDLTSIQEVVLLSNNIENTFIVNAPISLTKFDIGQNPITAIEFEDLPELSNLGLRGTQITEVDFSPFKELRELIVGDSQIRSLDVSMLENLTFLDSYNTPLTCIQVSEYQLDNYVSNWAVQSYEMLSTNCGEDDAIIEFENDALKAFLLERVDHNSDGEITKLEAKLAYGIGDESVDVSGSFKGLEYFDNLTELNLSNSSFSNIDLSNFQSLGSLHLGVSDMELDLSQNLELREVILTLEEQTSFITSSENNIDILILNSIKEGSNYDLSPFMNSSYMEISGIEMNSLNLNGLNNLEELKIESKSSDNETSESNFTTDFSDLISLQTLTLNFMRMEEVTGLENLYSLRNFLTYGAIISKLDFTSSNALETPSLYSTFSELRFGSNMQNLNIISYFPYHYGIPTEIYIPDNPNVLEINLSSVQYLELGELTNLELFNLEGFYNYETEQQTYTDLEIDLSKFNSLSNLQIKNVGVSNLILPRFNSSLNSFTLQISNSQVFPVENFEYQTDLERIDFVFNLSNFTLPGGADNLSYVEFRNCQELKTLNLSNAIGLSSLELNEVPKLECLTLPSGFDYTPPNGADYTSGCN